ncbi:MAG: HAD family hydrolase [Candidatus Binatia bacterium]
MKSQHHIHLNGTARPLRAIAFDLDSTLTKPYLDFRRLRAQLNLPEGDILQWLTGLPLPNQQHALQIIEAFEQDGVENVTWNNGAEEAISSIRGMRLPLAIVTRNSRASLIAVCEKLHLQVDQLVAREDAPPKPNPACIHFAAQQLAVPVDQLLMIGDYRHDTEAGRAAGAMTVLLTNGREPSWTVEADLVISRLPELFAYIT